MNTEELIAEAISLPVEGRALVLDSLLKSLNCPDPEIDAKWMEVAKRRLEELKSGKVQGIPADKVFPRQKA